jgi:hypothetical protein
MEKELLSNVLQIQAQLRVLHWQTESFAEHNAFGTTYDTLDDLFDSLIESYSGKYNRPKFGGMKNIAIADYDNVKVDAFIDGALTFFENAFMAESDSELNNICDEIKAALDKLKYLLTLK